jgi:hypothetical protein
MTVAHPHDVYNTINLVTQILCIPICTAFVALRFYTRWRFKQMLGIEDCKSIEPRTFLSPLRKNTLTNPTVDGCLIAWVLFMGYCVIGIYGKCLVDLEGTQVGR